MPLGCLASLFGIKEKPAAPEAPKGTVPDALPLEVKRAFFSRDENAFFAALEESLTGTPYRVFPNVRLNDLFTITAQEGKNAVYARLRDKHVDFLIVDATAAYRPVLAIELDGRSHQTGKQQHRDAVKDVAFRSAGLKLLRLPSRVYSAAELGGLLQTDLPTSRDQPAPRR